MVFAASRSSAKVDPLAPNCDVLIDDRPLKIVPQSGLTRLEITQDLEAPGMVTLEFDDYWDLSKGAIDDSLIDLFELGGQVEVKLGYGQQSESVFIGDITGLEPEFSREGPPRLVVRGHDFSHRLMRGTKTQTFTEMRDSDIVSQVARGAKLSVQASRTKEKLDYVLQHNQTDLAFIRQRAARIGYEAIVEHKKLLFRPFKLKEKSTLTLHLEDLWEFSPRLSTLGLVDKVEVRGWNPSQKKPEVIGKAQVGDQQFAKLGRVSGAKVAVKEFGRATRQIINQTASSIPEAKAIAEGQLNLIALGYITGQGSCQGNSALRPGNLITIEGIGKQFSGDYYVTATTHRYSEEVGYETEFTVRRNAT